MTTKKNSKPTDLVKLQVKLAKSLPKKDYDFAVEVLWGLLNGATYGIADTWSTKFLYDSEDIFFFHKNKKLEVPNNVVQFKVIQGGKNE